MAGLSELRSGEPMYGYSERAGEWEDGIWLV